MRALLLDLLQRRMDAGQFLPGTLDQQKRFGQRPVLGSLLDFIAQRGELVVVEPQKQIILETETLQLLATIVDLQYGQGPMPAESYFDRLTLELAIWPKGG